MNTIGRYAFSGCKGLTSTTISEGVTFIGRGAFQDCTGKLHLKCSTADAATSVNGAFYGSKFSDVVVANNVTNIGRYTFAKCDYLMYITIPKKQVKLLKGAFDVDRIIYVNAKKKNIKAAKIKR